MPRHIAIIMDGNGRWATSRGLPRTEGHRRGVESVRRTVKASIERGIACLTIFSFSSENWSRPQAEVLDLMELMKRFIRRDLADLHENDVRIRVIGRRADLDNDIRELIDEAEKLTVGNRGLQLTIAFNYGGRDEIVDAARALARRVADGELRAEDVSAETFAAALNTNGLPDLDLLIRTSGEMRLSNFLLWQAAYAEFVFLDVLWPDFDAECLGRAIETYRARERRFGGVSARSTA